MAELYTPSPWGAEFHSLTQWEALGAGSAGPGKTTVLIHEPDQQVVVEHQRCADKNHPHHIRWGESVGWALYLRRELVMLDQTIARACRAYKSMDQGFTFNSQKRIGMFSSGYKVQFGHCSSPDDWQQYFSNDFTMILFDELTQFEEEQYENITARLRTTDPVLRHMLKIRSMSNPFFRREGAAASVKDPFWVRRRFVEPAKDGRVNLTYTIQMPDGTEEKRSRIYLPARLSDNPDPVFVRQYYATLASKPEHIKRALLQGDWYFVAGAFFSDSFYPDRHVVKPFRIPWHWPRFRAMDWGYKTNGVVLWFAIDEDGNLVCYREFSFREMTDKQVALRVKEIEEDEGLWKDGESMLTGPADTQLWEQRGDSGKAKAEVFAENGIIWQPANKRPGSRASNAQRLLKCLKDWDDDNPIPGLVFFNTCKKCIETLPSIMPDEKDPETPAKGGDDHWLDTVMYAVAYASRPDRVVSPAEMDEEDDNDEEPISAGTGWGYGV